MQNYMPRLDGLRAVAVGVVLVTHFWSALLPGEIGVRIFFVLSGYLITRILLGYRKTSLSVGKAAAHFYWRRFLRLTPALYMAIACAAAFGIANMRKDWWAHALYLTNFLTAYRGGWGPATHLWTLAVEEQFYILWFFIVVALPKRWLVPIILASILIAPFFRTWSVSIGHRFLSTLLPGAFDFLAAGALLAYAEVENLWLTIRRTAASPLVTIAAFLVLALSSMIRQIYEWRIISSSATIILTASVILSVSMVEKNKLLDWLAWTPIRYCGRISYGIYVYHFFVPMLILLVFPNFGTILMVSRGGGIVRFAFLSVVTLLIAHFSWILVERPLLSLRDKQWKIGHNEREKIRISTPT